MNTNRTWTPRAVLIAALAAGALSTVALSLQACGGAGPDDQSAVSEPAEKSAKEAQDLSLIGIQLPQPTVTIGLNDASIRIDPIGLIDELLPPITIPDPFKPVNGILGAIEDGGTVSVIAPGVEVKVGIPGLPIPQLPDPFDGGIPLVTP